MRVMAEDLTQQPHEKRQLRLQAWEELNLSGAVGDPVWLKSVNWKFKKDEVAKPGKYGRIIVDLGVSASLQGAAWADHAKHQLGDRDIPVGKGHFHFATSPNPAAIIECLQKVKEPPGEWYLLVFSDDACFGARSDGKVSYGNLDISTCDASHTAHMFELLFAAFRCPEEIRKALMLQVMAPIRIHNPHNRRETILLRPTEPYLQSGITITTVLNVLAWYTIAHSFEMHALEPVSSAREVGYIVEYQPCSKFQELQFLKMSPMLDSTGQWRAVLNLGVILRASGTCRGDLPGRGPIGPRALQFQSALMNGLLSTIDYPPLSPLNPRTTTEVLDLRKVGGVLQFLELTGSERHSYNREQFYQRYSLSGDEIAEFEGLTNQLGLGMTVYSHVVAKVLTADYGLSVPLLCPPSLPAIGTPIPPLAPPPSPPGGTPPPCLPATTKK